MTLTAKIKKWKEKIDPYQSFIAMVIFFSGLFVGLYKFIVKPANLAITIHSQLVDYPSSIYKKVNNVYTFLKDSSTTKNRELLQNISDINDYLIYTNNYWEIKLKNETSDILKNVKIRLTSVGALNASSISSTFLLKAESAKIKDNIIFEKETGIIDITRIDVIPPNGELSIFLWGKIPQLAYDNNVFVTYDGGEAKPEKEVIATGFKAYLIDYVYELLILIFLVFLVLYRNIVKKGANASIKKISSDSN